MFGFTASSLERSKLQLPPKACVDGGVDFLIDFAAAKTAITAIDWDGAPSTPAATPGFVG